MICYTHTVLNFAVLMYSCLKFCVPYIIATFVCVKHVCGGTVAAVLTLGSAQWSAAHPDKGTSANDILHRDCLNAGRKGGGLP